MTKRKRTRALLTLAASALAVALTLFAVHGLWVGPAPDAAATAAAEQTAEPGPAAEPSVISADDTVPGARGNSIPVSWWRPENISGAPLVVICHGFTGDRQINGHTANLARALAEHGVASIAPDFPGQGANGEPTTAYTLANCAADIDACIDWMGAQQGADTQRVALVGHSMGGRIATEYLNLGAHAGAVQALALWSPADGDGLRGLEFLNIGDWSAVETWRAEAGANGTAAIGAWGDFTLSEEMFAAMEQSHPGETLRAFGGPILLCYAADESSVFTEESTVQPTIAAVEDCEKGTVVPRETFAGGGHNYIAADWDLPEDEAAALNAQLDEALRGVTLPFLLEALGAAG